MNSLVNVDENDPAYAAGGGVGSAAHLAQRVTPRKVQIRQMNVPHWVHG
jgi:hypothetical protein